MGSGVGLSSLESTPLPCEYAPDECIAIGDSRGDLESADAVGRFFLVANGIERDPEIDEAFAGRDNITVTSIVGRFLEHPRIYYFHNGGDEEILLGSADLMPRNLDRRVEQLFPVDDVRLRQAVRDQILDVHLRDNVQARRLLPEGGYERVHPQDGEKELDSQHWMIRHRGIWNRDELE